MRAQTGPKTIIGWGFCANQHQASSTPRVGSIQVSPYSTHKAVCGDTCLVLTRILAPHPYRVRSIARLRQTFSCTELRHAQTPLGSTEPSSCRFLSTVRLRQASSSQRLVAVSCCSLRRCSPRASTAASSAAAASAYEAFTYEAVYNDTSQSLLLKQCAVIHV